MIYVSTAIYWSLQSSVSQEEKKYVASVEVRIQSPLRETHHTGRVARISSD